MPLKTYLNFADRIIKALDKLEPRQIFEVLLGHLKNNKISTISFELFGRGLPAAVRQIARNDEQPSHGADSAIGVHRADSHQQDGSGYHENWQSTHQGGGDWALPAQLQGETAGRKHSCQKAAPKPRAHFSRVRCKTAITQQPKRHQDTEGQTRVAGGAEQLATGGVGALPHWRDAESCDKTNLSCFMMGGFEIVDYSDSINQLHRKLLTKILLNKWEARRRMVEVIA